MINNNEKIGNIYNTDTVKKYYETVGNDSESVKLTDADKKFESLVSQNLDNKIALDLGCGNGRYSEVLCKKGAKKVIGIDISESMIELAKTRKADKQLNQLELIRADIDNLSLDSEKIDYIISRFSLNYTHELYKAMQSIGNILSESGEVLIETNVATILNREEEEEIKKQPIPLNLAIENNEVKLKNFVYTLEDYTNAFRDANLKVDVNEQFPANGLSVDSRSKYKDSVLFDYYIFRLKKEKEDRD
jgi:ubiquinone/menaquinone biosynthesis C-methylase UbiE